MQDERERGGKLEVDPPNTSEPPSGDRETVRPQRRDEQPRRRRADSRSAERTTSPTAASETNKPVIIAILYLTSVLVGVTGFFAFILALVWRSEPGEAWEASHYDYHIMTFLLWLGTTVAAILLIMTLIGALIGFPLLLLAVVWVLVRSVMSLMRALNREPMPNPGTWLA